MQGDGESEEGGEVGREREKKKGDVVHIFVCSGCTQYQKISSQSKCSTSIITPTRLSLGLQTRTHTHTPYAEDCQKECKQLRQRLLKLGPKDRAEKAEARRELRRLAKEVKAPP